MMISADDHIDLWFLPRDLWLERLPSSMRDQAPRVEAKDDTGDYWFCEGQVWSHWTGGNWWSRPDRRKIALDRAGVGADYTLRPTTPDLRIEDMNRDGVEASVMFPPIIPMNVSDRALKIAVVQAYNDWAAEFQKQAPRKFLPVAMLFHDDPEASRDEVQRAAKLGLKQANFLVGTVTDAMYKEPWDPFWDAAEESNIVISYHVGGTGVILGRDTGPRERPQGRRPVFGMGLGNGANSFFEPFVGLFNHGILENHPKLRFVLGESGTGWIPFVVQEMDYRYQQVLERTKSGSEPLKCMPSEVFRKQVWATYQQDLVGLHLIDFFGEGHMMWASDYPHPDSTWPWSRDVIARETAHLSPEMRQKIIRDNAKAFYGI
jgi:predicted TIM-barrel fold metal-dependent hydrolase